MFSILGDFISLIYPELCLGCSRGLISQEKILCTKCRYDLPYADFCKSPDNVIARQFWGRVQIEQALAIWLFNKGNVIQHIMHQIKYNGAEEGAVYLGRLMGKKLLETNWFKPPEMIIPVPLSANRKRKRGYNQSEKLAEGIAHILGKPLCTNRLLRTGQAESQTRQSRYKRYENMRNQFVLVNGNSLAGRRILLVDDIITTGATIEACAQIINEKTTHLSVC